MTQNWPFSRLIMLRSQSGERQTTRQNSLRIDYAQLSLGEMRRIMKDCSASHLERLPATVNLATCDDQQRLCSPLTPGELES